MIPVFEDIDFAKFTVDQRLQLISRIWDSFEEKPPLVSQEQWEILERRAAEYEAAGEQGVPWSELRRRVGEKA